MKEVISCPGCGAPERVSTADEGTSCYLPVSESEVVAGLRISESRYRDLQDAYDALLERFTRCKEEKHDAI